MNNVLNNIKRVFQGGTPLPKKMKEYTMFVGRENKELHARLDSLEQSLENISGTVRALRRETEKSHDRIDQANLRTANIEHYTGMRSHSFENGGRMWNYMQMHKDIKQARRPQSLFVAKSRAMAA